MEQGEGGKEATEGGEICMTVCAVWHSCTFVAVLFGLPTL